MQSCAAAPNQRETLEGEGHGLLVPWTVQGLMLLREARIGIDTETFVRVREYENLRLADVDSGLKRYGPSQGREMIRGLTKAAKELGEDAVRALRRISKRSDVNREWSYVVHKAIDEYIERGWRENLILTNHDVAFLEACGVEAPAKKWSTNEELQPRFQEFFRTYIPEKTLGRQILERFWAEDR